MSSQSRRPMSHTCKGPHCPASWPPRSHAASYWGGTTILRASQGKKREISPRLGKAACILGKSFSTLIPQLVLSCSEGCPSARLLGWTGGRFNGFNCAGSPICLTSAHAFKDFSLCALLTHCWPKDHCISLPFIQFVVSAPPKFGSSFQKWKQPQSKDLWEGRILVFVHCSCLPILKTLCLCDGFFCIYIWQCVCCMDSAS